MGAWNGSVFGNDDAADFLIELEDAAPEEIAALMETALTGVLEAADYVEAPEGAIGAAAAALAVAWKRPELLNGETVNALVSRWPPNRRPLPLQLETMAAAVFDRLLLKRGNELVELWAEAGQIAEFEAELRRWRSFLP